MNKYNTLTIELYNDYLKRKSTTVNNHNGFYIQDKNKFLIQIKPELYAQLRHSLENRKVIILAENEKVVNKQYNTIRKYLLIDSIYRSKRLGVKALFERLRLQPRKKRVLNPNYFKNNYENQSRNKA